MSAPNVRVDDVVHADHPFRWWTTRCGLQYQYQTDVEDQPKKRHQRPVIDIGNPVDCMACVAMGDGHAAILDHAGPPR